MCSNKRNSGSSSDSDTESGPDADSESDTVLGADTDSESNTVPESDSLDRDGLHFVIAEDELEEGGRVLVDVNEREVAVVRLDDELHAFSNHCPHQGGPVGEGQVSGRFVLCDDGEGVADLRYDDANRIVSCPWHGWEFDLESGEHTSDPKYRLPQYEVVVREGDVYLSME